LKPPAARDGKWEREYRAFLKLRASLMPTFGGKFVAVHDGQVVGSGDDQIAVALGAYSKCGYVPIYVGLVSDEPQPSVRVPLPRLRRQVVGG
jgi:hypothetical protein